MPLIAADRRPAAGAARHRRRADDRPAEALRRLRCAGSARSAPTKPTTPACSTTARSPAGRCAAARGEPRPGPGPPQPRLARAAGAGRGRGRGHRDRPAGARGARRPAADRGHALGIGARRPSCSTSSPGTSARRDRGVIVAGRQIDPEPARAARPPGQGGRLPDPRRADLAAALRCATTAPRRQRLRPAAARRSASREAPVRAGPALRRDADQQAAARLARQRPRPTDRRRPRGWLERADQPGRGDPARRPGRAGRRASPSGSRDATAGRRRAWLQAEAAALRRSPPSSRRWRRRASRGCSSLSARCYRDGDLVYTASSMPIRDQEAFLPPARRRRPLPLQPRRQRHRRPGLLRDRRRPRQRPADDDRHRRPRPAPRHRRPGGAARRLDAGADRRHRQRRRRHLPLPAAGRGDGRATSSRRCSAPPARRRSVARPPPPSGSPTDGSGSLADLPGRSPPAPA